MNCALQGIFARYGAPVVVLSLLKRVEKRPRECLLGLEFEKAVNHINKKVCLRMLSSSLVLTFNESLRLHADAQSQPSKAASSIAYD